MGPTINSTINDLVRDFAGVIKTTEEHALELLGLALVDIAQSGSPLAIQLFGPIWVAEIKRRAQAKADEKEAAEAQAKLQARQEAEAAKLEAKREAEAARLQFQATAFAQKRERQTLEQKKRAKAEAQAKWRDKRKKLDETKAKEDAKARILKNIDLTVLAKTTSNASGFVGVYSHGRKWRGRAPDKNGGQMFLKSHETPEEAAWERYAYLKDQGLPTGTPREIELAVLAKRYPGIVDAEELAAATAEVEEIIAKTRLGWDAGSEVFDEKAWTADQEAKHEAGLRTEQSWQFYHKPRYLERKAEEAKRQAELAPPNFLTAELPAIPTTGSNIDPAVEDRLRRDQERRMAAEKQRREEAYWKAVAKKQADKAAAEAMTAAPAPTALPPPPTPRPQLRAVPAPLNAVLPPLTATPIEVPEGYSISKKEIRAWAKAERESRFGGVSPDDPPPPPPRVVVPLPPLSEEEHREIQAEIEREMGGDIAERIAEADKRPRAVESDPWVD